MGLGYGRHCEGSEAERRNLPYLFKLKMTKNVQKLIKQLERRQAWVPAVYGFEGQESTLQLTGWS